MNVQDIMAVVNNSKEDYKIYNSTNEQIVSVEYIEINRHFPYKITYSYYGEDDSDNFGNDESGWKTNDITTSEEGLLSIAKSWTKHTITTL